MPAFRSRTFPHARLVLAAAVWSAALGALPTKTFQTAACPVRPPTPLRALYVTSERVAAARVSSTQAVPGDRAANHRRTVFEVTESLKGDPGENRLEVMHWIANDPDNFRKGETVLLFLRPYGQDGREYYVTDPRFGAKRLSEDALALYVKRIKELQYILAQPVQDRRELTEWLVRCAEEPATRWEGAYELSNSLSMAEYEAERRKEREAQPAAPAAPAPPPAPGAKLTAVEMSAEAEAVVDEGSEDGEAVADDTGGGEVDIVREEYTAGGGLASGPAVDASIVNGLTAGQRRRLADALFASEKIEEGEMHLVRLVKSWDDERFTPFALRYLRGVEQDPPYEAGEVVAALAQSLKDDTLVGLSDEYTQNATFYDEPEEETGGEQEESEEWVGEEAAEESEETGEGEAGEETEEAETPQLLTTLHGPDGKRLNATQRRSLMLRNFLSAVDGRLSERALSALRP